MQRYETTVREGVLFLETDAERIEVGPIDDVCELIGTETYEIKYGERERAAAWVDTDDDGVFSFDVRTVLSTIGFDGEFVSHIGDIDAHATDPDGLPLRASVFVDMVTSIWNSKGSLDG